MLRELLGVKLALEKKKLTLSPFYTAPWRETSEECILPQSHIIGAITWHINQVIKKHIRGENPGGEKYVPFHLSDKLIMWAHSSLAIGLPSTHRTTPEQILWGIHMLQYIHSFISSCSIYAQAKVPRRKTTPSAYATNTMVTHCYRLWHRFPLTAKQHRHHGDYWPFFKSPLSTSSRRPAVCLRKGQAYLQPCIQVLWHPSGHNDVPGSSRYISFIGTVHGLTLACFFTLFLLHILVLSASFHNKSFVYLQLCPYLLPDNDNLCFLIITDK